LAGVGAEAAWASLVSGDMTKAMTSILGIGVGGTASGASAVGVAAWVLGLAGAAAGEEGCIGNGSCGHFYGSRCGVADVAAGVRERQGEGRSCDCARTRGRRQ
jgi:hypothetical protein